MDIADDIDREIKNVDAGRSKGSGWGSWYVIKATSDHTLMPDIAPPTARPAPQSLRRLFHDEDSADPDPFQSFAHQQPVTPHTTQEGYVDQFAPNPEISFDEDDDDERNFEGTVRQAKPKVRPSLGLTHSSDSVNIASSSHISDSSNDAATPTPIALPLDDDDSDDDTDLELPQAPFGQGQQLRAKASYDSLSSNPTTRAQISQEPRPAKEIRKPSGAGSVGDGLRGFQFPLSKVAMAARPPPLTRNASAMPLSAAAEDEYSSLSPSRPGLQRMQSAMPDLQPNSATTPVKPARPQISINLPPRPPMMRHASAAVMENRAQAQAQAQALAVAETTTRNLGVPGKPQIGLGVAVGMSRSRSGSRTDDHSVGLRDLMRVSSFRIHRNKAHDSYRQQYRVYQTSPLRLQRLEIQCSNTSNSLRWLKGSLLHYQSNLNHSKLPSPLMDPCLHFLEHYQPI